MREPRQDQPRVDLTTLAANIELPPDHWLFSPEYFIPSGPDPFTPEGAMYKIWQLENQLELLERAFAADKKFISAEFEDTRRKVECLIQQLNGLESKRPRPPNRW